MAHVKFIVDAERELKYLKVFIKSAGKSKLTSAALKLLEIDESQSNKLISGSYQDPEFKSFWDHFQTIWKTIESNYFDRITSITGYPWNLEEYECILTQHVAGFAVIPEKNVILLGREYRKSDGSIGSLSLEEQLYVLAHELFHLHYYEVARKEGLPLEVTKVEMAETVPLVVFFSDTELPKYWPSVNFEKAKSSYKEVQASFEYALTLWNDKTDYLDFLKKFVDKLKSSHPVP